MIYLRADLRAADQIGLSADLLMIHLFCWSTALPAPDRNSCRRFSPSSIDGPNKDDCRGTWGTSLPSRIRFGLSAVWISYKATISWKSSLLTAILSFKDPHFGNASSVAAVFARQSFTDMRSHSWAHSEFDYTTAWPQIEISRRRANRWRTCFYTHNFMSRNVNMQASVLPASEGI